MSTKSRRLGCLQHLLQAETHSASLPVSESCPAEDPLLRLWPVDHPFPLKMPPCFGFRSSAPTTLLLALPAHPSLKCLLPFSPTRVPPSPWPPSSTCPLLGNAANHTARQVIPNSKVPSAKLLSQLTTTRQKSHNSNRLLRSHMLWRD